MPELDVSAEVLSSIQARRRDRDETEDQILRRLLGLDGGFPETGGSGFLDATYGIHFPEGFGISRTYKGRAYAARVVGGRWLLNDGMAGGMAGGRSFDSLNQLSQAVIDGNENAWMFWFFKAPDGTMKRISDLRDPALVQKRPRRNRQRGKRQGVMPAAPAPAVRPKATGTPGAAPAPATPSAAARPISGPEPVSSSPLPPGEPESGGMAWQPAAKPWKE